MNFGKKTTDYEREKYRMAHENVENKKRGPKPKNTIPSTTASDNDESIKISKSKTTPKPIDADKPKNRVGRPYKVKFEQLLINNKTDVSNTPNHNTYYIDYIGHSINLLFFCNIYITSD